MIKIHGPELEEPFIPKFWLDRLVQPAKVKKPSKIFVGSMGDLFGDWVPEDWIIKVIGTAWFVAPHHTYIFLTKNPARYADFNPWPSNCWLLTTITCQKDADERIPELLKAQGPVLGVSLEPLLGPVDLLQAGGLELYTSWDDRMEEWDGINWLIIGAMTGPGSKQHQPKPEWIQSLIDQARAAGVSLFIKDNVNWTEKTQEWPGGLTQHR
jgi:protein gp37